MKSKKKIIIIILLFVSFNLYAEYFVVLSNPFYEAYDVYEDNDTEYSYAALQIEGTLLTIYRTSADEVITSSFPTDVIGTIRKKDDVQTKQVFSGLKIAGAGPYNLMWASTNQFTYMKINNPSVSTSGITYNTVTSSTVGFIESKSRATFRIPAGIPDSEFIGGGFGLDMYHQSPYKSNIVMSTPIKIKLVTIPNIQVISQNINFGKLDTGINSDKVAYGAFQINQNNANNNFTINYPTTINLINTKDQTSVPMNIDMLYGSQNGPSVGNNFNVPVSTNSIEIYLKAILPGSSIYNKSPGTYTGSVTVNVTLN